VVLAGRAACLRFQDDPWKSESPQGLQPNRCVSIRESPWNLTTSKTLSGLQLLPRGSNVIPMWFQFVPLGYDSDTSRWPLRRPNVANQALRRPDMATAAAALARRSQGR